MARFENLTVGTLLVEDVSAKVLRTGGDPLNGSASTQVTATAAELNQAADVSAGEALMAAGSGFSGTGTVCEHAIEKDGDLIKTSILIDITGLSEGGTAADIIGKSATANCHFGQITAAVNGTIIAGRITCFEAPATADADIDFYGSADEPTGTEDAALSSITGEELLINHGTWSAGEIAILSALPDADGYMYLTTGSGTTLADDVYTAGIFLIELWGV